MNPNNFLIIILSVTLLTSTAYALRDPTRPPGTPDVVMQTKQRFILTGIIQSPYRTFAIINGKKLTVGDMIEDRKVMKIEKSAVYVGDAEEVERLTLVPAHTPKSDSNAQ